MILDFDINHSHSEPGEERSAVLPSLVPRGTCSGVRSGTRRVWPHLHVQVATEDNNHFDYGVISQLLWAHLHVQVAADSNDYDLPYYKCCQ